MSPFGLSGPGAIWPFSTLSVAAGEHGMRRQVTVASDGFRIAGLVSWCGAIAANGGWNARRMDSQLTVIVIDDRGQILTET